MRERYSTTVKDIRLAHVYIEKKYGEGGIQKHVLCEWLILRESKLQSTTRCFYMQTIMLSQHLRGINTQQVI